MTRTVEQPPQRRPWTRLGWGRSLLLWTAWVILAVSFLVNLDTATSHAWTHTQTPAGNPERAHDGWDTLRGLAILSHLTLYRGYPWIFLAPFVLWLAARFTIERRTLRNRLPIHLAAATSFVLLCGALNRYLAPRQPVRLIIGISETVEDSGSHAEPPGVRSTHSRTVVKIALEHPPTGPPPTHSISPPTAPAPASNTIRRVDHTEAFWVPGAELGPPGPPPLFWFERARTLGLAGLLDLFVFASILGLTHAVSFHRRFEERERRTLTLESSLAKARLQTLQTQIQPHFLFNTLNSIVSLLRHDPKGAEDMLTSLSDLLRLALSQSSRQLNTLEEELRFLDLYMDIQHRRFGDRVHFTQIVQPDCKHLLVPTLILQPLIENALQHGIEPADHPGRIRLSAARNSDTLQLVVEDDGFGCPNLVQGTQPLGVGLSNIRDRLQALFPQTASIRFAPNTPSGLTVSLILPVQTLDPAPTDDVP